MTPRSLAQWLGYLEKLHPKSIDLGLDRVAMVARQLGLGKPAKRVISVAGSNGKGSTCAFLAALLSAQGWRVGVYSSPHLLRYNERVRIDGVDAGDEALCQAFAAVEAARGTVGLTYFEMGTLAALWLFQRAKLDAVILEVGLGGRLDAVNLVDADLALITSIALEHTDWLGDTRDAIAVEKAGICRTGRPALCGDPEPPQALLEFVKIHSIPLWVRGRDFDFEIKETSWSWQGRQGAPEQNRNGRELDRTQLVDLPLLQLPMESAALALQAIQLLGLILSPAQVAKALLETQIPGRLQRLVATHDGRRLAFVLDVAHNPHAAAYLAGRLRPLPGGARRFAVFGLLADKDLNGVLDPMLEGVQDWAVSTLPCERSRPGQDLYGALTAAGAQVSLHDNVGEALRAQCAKASEGDEILVFGSFYCVAAALAWLA